MKETIRGMIRWAEANPEYYQSMISKIPLRRLGELESDIGRVAVLLASEDSDILRVKQSWSMTNRLSYVNLYASQPIDH